MIIIKHGICETDQLFRIYLKYYYVSAYLALLTTISMQPKFSWPAFTALSMSLLLATLRDTGNTLAPYFRQRVEAVPACEQW